MSKKCHLTFLSQKLWTSTTGQVHNLFSRTNSRIQLIAILYTTQWMIVFTNNNRGRWSWYFTKGKSLDLKLPADFEDTASIREVGITHRFKCSWKIFEPNQNSPSVLQTARPHTNKIKYLFLSSECLSSDWVKLRELSLTRKTDVASSGLMLIWMLKSKANSTVPTVALTEFQWIHLWYISYTLIVYTPL